MKHEIKAGGLLALFGTAFLICLPVLLLFCGSLQGADELKSELAPILGEGTGVIDFHLFPAYPTLVHYLEVFFDRPEFYTVLFNSFLIVTGTLLGHLLFGLPSAWAFARFQFPGKRILFFLYVVLMMLPFSVTMLSQYLVLNRLALLDSLWGIILPGAFSTFPVFIMYRGFCAIPQGMLEAARIDGAGEWQLFFHIGLPLGYSGVASALVLGFLEYFSLIEQPLAFLKERALWPLSLYLPNIGLSDAGYAFAASVTTLLPALVVFALGRDYLEKGIVAAGMKE